MHINRPIGLWCSLHSPPKEQGACSKDILARLAKEVGTSGVSDEFVRQMMTREIKTTVACQQAVRELHQLPNTVPNRAEVRACEGEVWEWARLQNEVEDFCLQKGAAHINCRHLPDHLSDTWSCQLCGKPDERVSAQGAGVSTAGPMAKVL